MKKMMIMRELQEWLGIKRVNLSIASQHLRPPSVRRTRSEFKK